MTSEVTHRTIETNGIRMHLAEAGAGPLVLLCHGFPESWYSWRHQLPALAEAGFHAVAPDMRGYGRTDRPEAIDQYTLLHLIGDMVGLVDTLGAEQAVIAGHDWGAPVAWRAALMRPDRFRGVIGLSVPYTPRGPERPTRRLRIHATPPQPTWAARLRMNSPYLCSFLYSDIRLMPSSAAARRRLLLCFRRTTTIRFASSLPFPARATCSYDEGSRSEAGAVR